MQFNPVNPSVPALKWGREHEEIACDEYFAWADENHDSLTIRDSGLVINSAFPYLGAMPDGVITCNCFGVGLVEIKCPYKYKDVHPTALVALRSRLLFDRIFWSCYTSTKSYLLPPNPSSNECL